MKGSRMKKYYCDVCGKQMQDFASEMTVQGADGIRLTVEAHPAGLKSFWKREGSHVCRHCIARAFWP